MSLKEVVWTCECGTKIRYYNKTRKIGHDKSQKHQQYLQDGIVIEKKYIQRNRQADKIKIVKLGDNQD